MVSGGAGLQSWSPRSVPWIWPPRGDPIVGVPCNGSAVGGTL
jgi:hypothetical protein